MEFKFGNIITMINKLSTYDEEYFVLETKEGGYVSFNGDSYYYCNDLQMSKGMFLFGLVKKDFDKWLELNQNPIFENYYPHSHKKQLRHENSISYDIDHAYWRIAYLNGYISKDTYDHGIKLKYKDDSMKQVYCMALSSQGRSKTLKGYKGIKPIKKTITLEKNTKHIEIYQDICNRTHKVMNDIMEEIWNDFVNYHVDCITFNGHHNCQIVEKFLTDRNLTFKKI